MLKPIVMIKKLLFLLLLIPFATAFGQEHDCAYFKTGQFRIVDEAMGYEAMIERDENYQTEYTKGTGNIAKYKIDWKDDCNFELELVETNDKQAQDFIGTKFAIQITDIKELTYSFDITIVGTGHSSTYQMTKIE